MINVRAGQSSDVEIIAEFQISMAKESEGMMLDRDTVLAGVKGVFDKPSRGRYWVAENEGKPIGVCMTVPEWSDWRNGTVLWIHSLYVEPKFRRKGVFKKMYLYLKDRVQRSNDLVGLRLYVDKNNKSAQNVYEKIGMTKDHYELYEWMEKR